MGVVLFILIILVLAGVMSYFILSNFKSQMNLELKLEPQELLKGEKVKVIVKANPSQKVKILSLDGHLIGKKYDGYKGSWLEKSDLPYISPGIVLRKTLFSFGENIELEAGKERTFTGTIPIPDDAVPTEIRGVMQVHWFVTVKAKVMPYLPPVVLQEELVILRKEIYDEKLPMEEQGEYTDFYDPTYDLERPTQKATILEAQVISEEKEEERKIEEELPVSKKEPSRVPVVEKKKVEFVPPAAPPKVEEPLKVKYRTPYDPGRKMMEEAKKYKEILEKEKSKEVTGSLGAETKKGPSYHVGDEYGAKKEEKPSVPPRLKEEYKVRHHIERKGVPKIDTSHIPEKYKTRHISTDKLKKKIHLRRKEFIKEPEAESDEGLVLKPRKKRDKFSNLDKYTK